MNLALIGYRGTGKTTVARRLALRLGWDWIDADVELELRAGKGIAAVFADEGEPAFRDLESAVLAQLIDRPRTVLATGGGVVLREDNRQLLRRAAAVVWLRADPETIHRRLAADAATADRRPNLTAQGGLSEIVRLLAEREPWYEQCATLQVDTANRSPDEIVAEILVGVPAAAGPKT